MIDNTLSPNNTSTSTTLDKVIDYIPNNPFYFPYVTIHIAISVYGFTKLYQAMSNNYKHDSAIVKYKAITTKFEVRHKIIDEQRDYTSANKLLLTDLQEEIAPINLIIYNTPTVSIITPFVITIIPIITIAADSVIKPYFNQYAIVVTEIISIVSAKYPGAAADVVGANINDMFNSIVTVVDPLSYLDTILDNGLLLTFE